MSEELQKNNGHFKNAEVKLSILLVLTQTCDEDGAIRVLKLRQIEPEFLERIFSLEDI